MPGIEKDRLIQEIQKLTKNALFAAGKQVTTEADPYVPIAEGTLRTTEKVEEGEGLTVIISYGGTAIDGKQVKYAQKQYYSSLRHFMPGGFPAPIQSLPRGEGLPGFKNIYGRSYRQALKDGILRRVAGGLQWLDRMFKDVRARRRINQVFTNFYK